jgi:hypothetical protein
VHSHPQINPPEQQRLAAAVCKAVAPTPTNAIPLYIVPGLVREDWKNQHKKICKLLNVGMGMQALIYMSNCQSCKGRIR